MLNLTFYRQERHDGGVRTGLEIDGVSLLHDFKEGPSELQGDPLGAALEWYVDLRCYGDALPTEPEQARSWLLSQSGVVQPGLLRFADAIEAGTDDSFPLKWSDFPDTPAGVRFEGVCSAVRRVSERRLGEIVKGFATDFSENLAALSQPEPSLR